MPRTCRACRHEKRSEIDLSLARGEPFRNVAERTGLSLAGLVRHRAHVANTVSKRQEGRELLSAERLVERLGALEQKARTILERAMRRGEHRTAVAALSELRRQVETLVSLAAALRRPDESEVVTIDVSIGASVAADITDAAPGKLLLARPVEAEPEGAADEEVF